MFHKLFTIFNTYLFFLGNSSNSNSSSSQSFKENDIIELINLGFSREQVIIIEK